MEKITVLEDIKPIVNSFNGLGINIDLNNERIFKNPKRLAILMCVVVMWAIAFSRYSLRYLNDVDALAPGMTMDVELFLTFSKLVIFMVRRKRFLRLNEAIKRLALTGNLKERELWNTENRAVLSISKTYLVTIYLTAFVCVVLPILKLSYYYAFYHDIVYTLPLPGIFPYDFTLPYYFVLTILLTILLAIFFIYILLGVDCLFSWFVFNISAHLQIMHLKLEHLLQLPIDDRKYQLDLAALITYHTEIISLSTEFKAVYAPVIFMVVTCSCLPLCFLVYQLSYLTEPSSVPLIFMMLMSITLQLILYCFGGEKVQNGCEQLCDAMYMLIPWHKLPPKQRLLYLMPLIRSQRILNLTGYFFTANRSLLVWIFKTTWSFIAMLSALRKKEN